MRYPFLSLLSFAALTPGLPGSTLPADNCLELDTPVVTAGNLATRVALFGQLPPEHRFGFAPDPGMTRIISAGEMTRHLAAATKDNPKTRPIVEQGLCVVRMSRRITALEAIAAIRAAFQGRRIEVEILGLSKQAVAKSGELRFSLHELPNASSPDAAVTWNGWFREPHGRKRPVWARVKLKEVARQSVARKDIAVGETLSEENSAEELRESFPWTSKPPSPHGSFIGRTARSAILAGQRIESDRLAQTPVIHRGDRVILETVTPHTRLSVEGRAESTAYRGQRVSITTALSKKVIQAVAQDLGRATVSSAETVSAKGQP